MAESNSPPSFRTNDTRLLLIIVVVLGILLTATTIPGVFIIDEDNYLVSTLALRHGGFVAPGTESLSRSRELAYFDPEPHRREVEKTPLVSLVAPVYAFLTLPFSYLGWRGLALVNTLAFLFTAFVLFKLVSKLSSARLTPWISCGAFLFGTYSIEYAQGVWPHMLSAMLCVVSFYFLLESLHQPHFRYALIAGILIGVATGIREQNIFVAGCLGVGLFLFAEHRLRSAAAYGAGVTLLLLLISIINYLKFGFFHPFPKIYGFMSDVSGTQAASPIIEPLKVLWAKVVDFSFSGPIQDPVKAALFHRAQGSGAVLVYGIVKKSLIQSAPWAGVPLVGIVWLWMNTAHFENDVRKVLKMISLVVLPTLIMIGLAGFGRTDALSFNQRYFLEILPFCALALGLLVEKSEVRISHAILGLVLGALLVIGVLNISSAYSRYLGQLRIPIFLCATFIIVWGLSLWREQRFFLSLFLGLTIGWSFFIHLQTDLTGSRTRRQDNLQRYEILDKIIPDHSALFAYWGNKDAAGPLQLDRDVVILDLWADQGESAARLTGELLSKGRRVFVLLMDVPDKVLEQIVSSRHTRPFSESFMNFVEILDDRATH